MAAITADRDVLFGLLALRNGLIDEGQLVAAFQAWTRERHRAPEAVCLKAMATRPEDRYATSRLLAEDIERWMADEPATAYPERRLERLARWLRLHRTWTCAAVVTLIGICSAAIVAAALIESSRRRESAARREAELGFHMAQDAVDSYLVSVSENKLLKEQDSVDIRNLVRNSVSDTAENPGPAGALSRAAQENDAVPLERGAELPRHHSIGLYT